MDHDPFNPLFSLLGFFVAALVIFHLLLVWPRNLSKKGWKYVDYAWLAIALLTIVSLSSDIRRQITETKLELAIQRAKTMHALFSDLYVNQPPSYVCIKFVRDEFSPDNFDCVQEEFDRMCDWFGHFGSRFSNATLPDYHSFPVELIEEPNLTNEFLVEVIGELKRQLSYYNDAVDVRMRVSRETAETEFEKSIRFIWPWLFSLAIALRTSKVTGEVLHER